MNIYYSKSEKRNYFLLGYFYNHSGHFKVTEHAKKSEELAKKYGYSVDSMFMYEIQKSPSSANHIFMYSNKDNQNPIEGASICDNLPTHLR